MPRYKFQELEELLLVLDQRYPEKWTNLLSKIPWHNYELVSVLKAQCPHWNRV
jgi:hypothetical protein